MCRLSWWVGQVPTEQCRLDYKKIRVDADVTRLVGHGHDIFSVEAPHLPLASLNVQRERVPSTRTKLSRHDALSLE